jgi:CHAT domain-containing protein
MRWLTGTNPTLTRLSLLDLTQGTNDLIALVAAFPGLLELLPQEQDFSRPEFWQDLRQALGADWQPAPADALHQARETWDLLRGAAPDPRHMVYVAGHQEATVADYRLEAGADPVGPKRLTFLATAQGDGTVTWRSGLLPEVPVWYVEDTAHDALCTQRSAFPGYLDLLTTGKTERLSAVPPGTARSAAGETGATLFPLPERPPTDDLPDQQTVESSSFGPGLPPAETDAATRAAPLIRLSICHGDLAYARHPVLVGHYQGDTIVSAERALDQRLAGRLSEHLGLGLYPGQPGTHAVFISERPRTRPAGALVVGLGQVGDLTPMLLETGVRDTLIDFALRVARWSDDRFGAERTVRSAACSALLVGSGAGGLPVGDVVKAILRGAIAAARRLADAGLDDRVAIDAIQFIEIYQDAAITAAASLDDALRDDVLAAQVSWPQRPTLEEGQGRQQRVRCDDAPEWWQRLEVIQEEGSDALRFIAATDRARAEVTLAAGQLRLADGFIAQASRSPAANTEAAKTLFEMLLPNRLRELAPRQQDLVILVDEVSARFPWELLEDRWGATGRPPAVQGGMVRQLKALTYRTHPVHTQEPKAFVVGNPDLEGWDLFPDLPGAREEATRVAQLLRAQGFQVCDRIDEKADAILNGLHKDSWRILHLAGHGEHEFTMTARPPAPCPACGQVPTCEPQRLSGMVIGRETFLTPGDVEQMRWVPELVFINCCHLGKTLRATPPRYNVLAANLAVQFVHMGVKAVIAAGWAIDDQAGLAFAEHFYNGMFAGLNFGDAVRAAREAVWTRFPEVNTWGAYQCYGDPGLRLRLVRTAGASAPRRPYHAPCELVADLDNLSEQNRMQARQCGDDAAALIRLRADIEDLLRAIPEGRRVPWLKRADVAAALGLALGETRACREAVTYLEQARAADEGDCPLRALDGLQEFRIRLIAADWQTLRTQTPDDQWEDRRQELTQRTEQCLGELVMLCQGDATADRLMLVSFACRQLAWLQTDRRARLEALVNMAHYLERALTKSDTKRARFFPLWAVAKLLARGLDPGQDGDWSRRLPQDLERSRAEAADLNAREPSFRNAVAEVDNDAVRLLLETRPPTDAADRISDRYREVFSTGVSPLEIAKVQEGLDFVSEVGDWLPNPVREALRTIRDRL